MTSKKELIVVVSNGQQPDSQEPWTHLGQILLLSDESLLKGKDKKKKKYYFTVFLFNTNKFL